MLKQRVVTALILAAPVVWSVLNLATPYVALLLLGVIGLAGWEWAKLSGLTDLLGPSLYVLTLALLGLLTWWVLQRLAGFGTIFFSLTLMGWLLVTLRLILRPQPRLRGSQPSVSWLVVGLLVLIPPFVGLLVLHAAPDRGPLLVLFILCLVWVADIGAYFVGRRWGRLKVSPLLSPGKSWEGVIGGLVAVFFYAAGAAWALGLSGPRGGAFVGLAMLAAVFSVVGDLFESLLKREANQKDSGGLLPGHGGVLDRIDSLTASGPLFVWGMSWF
jgi:phosphatidate cytidylyltransferase